MAYIILNGAVKSLSEDEKHRGGQSPVFRFPLEVCTESGAVGGNLKSIISTVRARIRSTSTSHCIEQSRKVNTRVTRVR